MDSSNRFGRYEVEEEVARGGMGVIYRVRDPEMRRFLAMKVLLPDGEAEGDSATSQQSKQSARFIDEAQLTGQLDHPGIIPVYDMGRDDEGRLFFTMRLVKGRTLEEVFDLVQSGEDGWTLTGALGVLQKVCGAMAFAHEHGVLHRDLKPANIMVGRFGETYVMDWGLAKLLDGTSPEPSQKERTASDQTILTSLRKDDSSHGGELSTLDGDVMGTPAYMSLEQARGEVDRLSPQSDIYAVGAMLYHLLAGHAPYRAKGEDTPAHEVLLKLFDGPPPSIEREAREVPAELCAICERAMAREPGDRYSSMLSVAEDLQAFVENRVVQAYRRGAVVEFKKWVQRNRAIAGSLAAIFVLVIAGLAWISLVQTQARDAVEDKNLLLEESYAVVDAERARTSEALERAELSQSKAIESEQVAIANEKEALWQSYVGNIAAAHAALEIGSASEARRRLAVCPEALRNWEWQYLSQRAEASLKVLTGSSTFVHCLAVSPADTLVAGAGGTDGTTGLADFAIRIWDYESGQLTHELESHKSNVTSLAFSPAGEALASLDSRGVLNLWDVVNGVVGVQTSGMGSFLDYHPDGRFIATASLTSGTLQVWDSYERKVVARKDVPSASNAIRYSRDGSQLAVAGKDGHIRILDQNLMTVLDLDGSGEALDIERRIDRGTISGRGVFAVDFAPDGRRLVSGSDDGFIRIWNLASGEREHLMQSSQSNVRAVSWHPQFSWIVSGGESGSLRFWNSETGRALDVLRGHDGSIHAMGFSELGDRLLSASRDATVRIWDGQAGTNDTILEGLRYTNTAPYRLAFAPDNDRVVWRSDEHAFTITDTRTGEDQCSIWVREDDSVRGIEFGAGAVWMCDDTGRISRWDPVTGVQITRVETGWFVHAGIILSRMNAAFLAGQSKEEILGGGTRFLGRVDINTGDAAWTLPLDLYPIAVRVTPDAGLCLVLCQSNQGENSTILRVDPESGDVIWRKDNLASISSLAAFPDGKRFAYSVNDSWDNSLNVCSAETGELMVRLTGHAQPIALAVSPDGTRVASNNWDGTVSLWSPERGEILSFPAHTEFGASVEFSPDGLTIASLGIDGLRRLWSASSSESRSDARMEAAQRRRWSVDARERVDELLKTRVHVASVVEALKADRSLRTKQREAAIYLARAAAISIEGLVERSFRIVVQPGRPGAEYMAAMQGSRLVLEMIPSLVGLPANELAQVAPKIASVHVTVGAAQVQLGSYREALATLDLAEEVHSSGVNWGSPLISILRAWAHHELGESDAAQVEFESASNEKKLLPANIDQAYVEAMGMVEMYVKWLLDNK